MDALIPAGDRDELTIRADDNLLEYFETDVRDGILRIDVRDHTSLHTNTDVVYHLVIRDLESVRASSSGDVRVWTTERLRAATSSSGSIHFRGNPATVQAEESSSGDIERID